jgi:hypothetical protein
VTDTSSSSGTPTTGASPAETPSPGASPAASASPAAGASPAASSPLPPGSASRAPYPAFAGTAAFAVTLRFTGIGADALKSALGNSSTALSRALGRFFSCVAASQLAVATAVAAADARSLPLAVAAVPP